MHLVVYLVGNKSMALNKSRHLAMRESNPSRLALMKNLSHLQKNGLCLPLLLNLHPWNRAGSTLLSSLTNIVLKKTL